MQNKYKYNLNLVDNILGITNSANSQNITEKNKAKLGVAYSHSYTYDGINRLVSANGKAKTASYWLDMTYGIMGEPLTKKQKVDSSKVAQSYAFAYLYEAGDHPTAPSQIGHNHNTYDANGNPLTVTNDGTSETREMYWDEDNWLMVLSDNGKTSRYTYNASGERIIKSHGTMEGVYINGAPQGITFHETDNFTLYPASILTVNKNRFTKHYFIGSQRIASRIGTGLFNNVYGRNGSYVTAGQQDYAERMNQIQKQKETYYKQQGIAPGVPTEKGAYGDPENTGVGYNAVLTELGNHDVPQGWVQTPRPNTTPNTNPGPLVSWNDPSNPDDPQAGYGYIPNDTTKEETFFYHSDHLGSISYITDDKANITQYDAYLPYGELLVDEHSSSEDLPYKFNGKQFDEGTGLYYYGARYLNPVTSLWYGVDPKKELSDFWGCYLYCNDNPIILIDKFGEKTEKNNPKKKPIYYVFESRWPNVYKTYKKYLGKKTTKNLTYDSNPNNRRERRQESLRGYSVQPGFDRDEFPYATTKEGGKGAAVNYVPSPENRSHGANLGSFIRVNKLKSGDKFLVVLVPANNRKRPSPYTVPTTRSYRQQEPVDNVMVGVALGKVFSGLLNVFEKVAQRATPILIPPTTIYMNEINDGRNPQIQ